MTDIWAPTRFKPLRTKGYRKPPNSIVCGRSSMAGNPFIGIDAGLAFGDWLAQLVEMTGECDNGAISAPQLGALTRKVVNKFNVAKRDNYGWNPRMLRGRIRSGYYRQFDAIGCPGCEPDSPHCHLIPLIEAANKYGPKEPHNGR